MASYLLDYQSMFVGNVNIIGGTEADLASVLSMLEREGEHAKANPDLFLRVYKQFGVDDARDVATRAASRALGKRRAFVLFVDGITNEAQNALLKTLEETPGNALFVFVHPAPSTLLPTLRSRAHIFSLPGRELHDDKAEDFLRAPAKERLELLKPFLERGEDDRRDLGVVLAFLAGLERALRAKEGAPRREGLRAVYRARRYLGDRGALWKPLLEQLALLVPEVY